MAQIFVDETATGRTVEWFARYTKCTQRNLVSVVRLTEASQALLNLESLPAMTLKLGDEPILNASLFSIIRHLAVEANLEKIFFGDKPDLNIAILSFLEVSQKLPVDELIDFLNKSLETES